MFFIACEIRDNPSLADKPCAVGGGVISTSNYVARKFGVRSAMPEFIAKQLCPDLIIVKSNMQKYRDTSRLFKQVLIAYDSRMESMGLDEAKIDVTEYMESKGIGRTKENLCALMEEIRLKIYQQTGVTASAGCAANKMLAKLCSEENKPDGSFYLEPKRDKIL